MFLIIYNHATFFSNFSMQFFHKIPKIQYLYMSYNFSFVQLSDHIFPESKFLVFFFVRHEKWAQKKTVFIKNTVFLTYRLNQIFLYFRRK